jgi:hypothetical protein
VTLNSPELASIENDALFRYKLGTVGFTPVANPPIVDINAKSLTAARLNSDAFTDLVVANSASSTLSVFRGGGDLSFMSMAAFSSVLPVVSSRVADFDGDSIPDLLANSAASFIFFQGQTNRSFSQDNQYVYSSKQIEIGDFNNDQKPDLIALNSTQTQIDIYMNGGSFNFNAKPAITLPGPSNAVAVGDLNGDSHLDFVVMDGGSSQALVYLGIGDGTFDALRGFPTGSGPVLLGTTDLDGDGKLDLVIASSGGQPSLMAAFGRGDGTFSTTSLGIAANPKLLVLDDLDCDGQPEAIIYHQGTTQLSIYGNRGGQLGFAAPMSVNTGVVIGSFAVSTLDADSKPDIALISSTAPASLVLLRNTSN